MRHEHRCKHVLNRAQIHERRPIAAERVAAAQRDLGMRARLAEAQQLRAKHSRVQRPRLAQRSAVRIELQRCERCVPYVTVKGGLDMRKVDRDEAPRLRRKHHLVRDLRLGVPDTDLRKHRAEVGCKRR